MAPARTDGGIPNGKRSDDMAYILLIGLTGAGKSSTMNSKFDRTCKTDEGIFSSATQSILEYRVEVQTDLGSCKRNLIVTDTPGFGDTTSVRQYEKDSQILATLESYLAEHRELSVCYPTAVFLVIDFSDRRIDDEKSLFIQQLKAIEHLIQRGILIDTNPTTCNLIIVLTHFMDASPELQKCPEPKVRLIQGLIKTFTSIPADIPIIMAENKANDFGLRTDAKGSYELPNGDMYPFNLFKAFKDVADKVENEKVTNIILEAYAASASLTKVVLDEKELVDAQTESALMYHEIITNTETIFPENEMTKLLEREWEKVSGSQTRNNPIVLQIAKTIFCQAEIDSVNKIPNGTKDVLQLVRQLVVNETLEKTLYNIYIVPPCLLEHCKSVGYFYDVKNDVMSIFTPFEMKEEVITHSGFRAPPVMRVDLIGNKSAKTYVQMNCYQSMTDYFSSRYRQLHLGSQNSSIGNRDADPILGNNIVPNGKIPDEITGILEFREYSASLTKKCQFSPKYINALENLSAYNANTKVEWASLLAQGIYVIKSGFLGGLVSVTATRNADKQQTTSVDNVKETIRVILEDVGKVKGNRKLQAIEDWSFKLKFHGGDPNLNRPRLENLFSASGSKLFYEWKNSIQLRPTLLLSELQLEHISSYLRTKHSALSERVSNAAFNAFGYRKYVDPDRKIPEPNIPPKSNTSSGGGGGGPCAIL